ncbi:TraX family protein [Lacrimispora sp.]|uniref:TraX family protein n=1 Tax=Lacrimispora sp. TaxID=2719234 RepID=UPI0028B044E0|nr:TraX family protein [Lacrimispora sp.]
MLQKGLNSFQIKIIALVLMVFDHIHYAFTGVFQVPMWFTMLGRLSAPLFIFATANGMRYTRNPVKYLMRLWIGFVFMGFGNDLINKYFPLPSGGIIINNIFSTLLVICLIIFSIQRISICRKENRPFLQYVLLMLVPVFSSIIILMTLSNPSLLFITRGIMFFVPSLLFCEGGYIFVAIGVGLYLCNQDKKKIGIFYLVFSMLVFAMGYNPEIGVKSMFLDNIQWYMVFALPFMLLYNKQKGRGMKYFFYAFYPAHIYIFVILANIISKY